MWRRVVIFVFSVAVSLRLCKGESWTKEEKTNGTEIQTTRFGQDLKLQKGFDWNLTGENLLRFEDGRFFTLNYSESGGTDGFTEETNSKTGEKAKERIDGTNERYDSDKNGADEKSHFGHDIKSVHFNLKKTLSPDETIPQRCDKYKGDCLSVSKKEPEEMEKKINFRSLNGKDSKEDSNECFKRNCDGNNNERGLLLNGKERSQGSEEEKLKERFKEEATNEKRSKQTSQKYNKYEEVGEQSEQRNDSKETDAYRSGNEKTLLTHDGPEIDIKGVISKENVTEEQKNKRMVESNRGYEVIQKESNELKAKENVNPDLLPQAISKDGKGNLSKLGTVEGVATESNYSPLNSLQPETKSQEYSRNSENTDKNKGINSKENFDEHPGNPKISQRFLLGNFVPLPEELEPATVKMGVYSKETNQDDNDNYLKESNNHHSASSDGVKDRLELRRGIDSRESFYKNQRNREYGYNEQNGRWNSKEMENSNGNKQNQFTPQRFINKGEGNYETKNWQQNGQWNSRSKEKKSNQEKINFLFGGRRDEQQRDDDGRRDFDSKETYYQNQLNFPTTQRYDGHQMNFPSNHHSSEREKERDIGNYDRRQWNHQTTKTYGNDEINFYSNDRFEKGKNSQNERKDFYSKESFNKNTEGTHSGNHSKDKKKNSMQQNNQNNGRDENSKEIFKGEETSYYKNDRFEEPEKERSDSKETFNKGLGGGGSNGGGRPSKDRPKGTSKEGLIPMEKCGQDVPRRIIGGSSTDIDEFPWLGLLQYVDRSGKVSQDCSGVLISKRYVLTAAHCTHGLGLTSRNMELKKVRLGEWDTSTEEDCQGDVCSPRPQEIDVEEVVPHEGYKPKDKSQMNDIALIRLKQEAALSQFVQPICLPFGEIGNTDYEDKKLTVSGWGKTSNARDSSSSIKMKVDLPVVSRNKCKDFYKSFYGNLKISESQFCAGGEEGKDSCQGDSGGPLMTTEKTSSEMKWYVVGIVSSGPAACGVEGRPSLYTNVSQFTEWISAHVRN